MQIRFGTNVIFLIDLPGLWSVASGNLSGGRGTLLLNDYDRFIGSWR